MMLFQIAKTLFFILKFTYQKNLSLVLSNRIILSRTACLGNEIIERLFGKSLMRCNHQKTRVDLLINNKSSYIPIRYLQKIINRIDILGIVYIQNFDFFGYKKPKYIIIDSYSELTDQKFNHSEYGFSFYCNYSDIRRQSKMFDNYSCEGLLALENISELYEKFVQQIIIKWGADIPILFIHFPTQLDERIIFKQRADLIQKSIDTLSNKYANLHSISIEDEYVDFANTGTEENKKFPYHYHSKTYARFVEKILELGIFHEL